ncbi:TetR/AcrR family transcriptional regulator [Acinetobacter sp. C26M]|uniref:TetR/AcrR family transcriptional regulator n=1 Tax=unclassified Acinetobacter TaxID=196816 RepID=UPI0014226026|nr:MULTISPECIES: TetR/AcrR family transcriptional regulator [unclassified Acinetobacter]NIE95024.1 TetR/AcrR family transcriptional regulator [Acinetobacter sp. Tr-809]USA48058.1 TetR/AcrR family transcriptional regulator [Acinetobacter sp. C26M]USA51538.1 TetR/AcrR family transcriptional regulator [Acinetobacter sp. C26G]
MTAAKIQKIALERFAKQGFAATSLNEIATDVGIKKPSIYAHFKNKDELYLSLIPIMIDEELGHAKIVLQGGTEIQQQLHTYLAGIEQRFNESYGVQFWMNALISPPVHLYDQVIEPMHVFMAELEQVFSQAIQHSVLMENKYQLDSLVLARVCMSFVDALQSELIYGGREKFQLRLDAILKALDILIST